MISCGCQLNCTRFAEIPGEARQANTFAEAAVALVLALDAAATICLTAVSGVSQWADALPGESAALAPILACDSGTWSDLATVSSPSGRTNTLFTIAVALVQALPTDISLAAVPGVSGRADAFAEVTLAAVLAWDIGAGAGLASFSGVPLWASTLPADANAPVLANDTHTATDLAAVPGVPVRTDAFAEVAFTPVLAHNVGTRTKLTAVS